MPKLPIFDCIISKIKKETKELWYEKWNSMKTHFNFKTDQKNFLLEETSEN